MQNCNKEKRNKEKWNKEKWNKEKWNKEKWNKEKWNKRKCNKDKGQKYNKKDLLFIICVLLAVAFLGIVFWRKRTDQNGSYIEITIDGELYGSYSLEQEQEIVVESSYGTNSVVIKDGKAFVAEADCPDQVCVAMQPVSRSGEIICCLPHHLFIEAYGKEKAPYDAMVL